MRYYEIEEGANGARARGLTFQEALEIAGGGDSLRELERRAREDAAVQSGFCAEFGFMKRGTASLSVPVASDRQSDITLTVVTEPDGN